MDTPKRTLYINNLNDQVKPREIKELLYGLFSQYGDILDIINKNSKKLRGQAWIIFRDVTESSNALQKLNGFLFLGKPLSIEYAREESFLFAKLDGTFDPRMAKKKSSRVEMEKPEKEKEKEDASVEKEEKEIPMDEEKANGIVEGPKIGESSRILYLENIPAEFSQGDLESLYREHSGFLSASLVPRKPGVGFVEFSNESESSSALKATEGLKMSNNKLLKVSYAVKTK